MKRVFALLMILALAACGVAASGEAEESRYEAVAQAAVDELLACWTEIYAADYFEGHTGYLEIKNTRVLQIADNPVSNVSDDADATVQSSFGDYEYIVEFILLADYFFSEPYYSQPRQYDCVGIRENGEARMIMDLFRLYSGRHYSFDYTGIIDEIVDLQDAFNGVYRLR